MGVNTQLLALGANMAGPWGSPDEALRRARCELSCAGLRILASSHIYNTVPLLEVDPHWRHPALATSGRTLLARLDRASQRGIRQSLDFAPSSCDKARR